MKLWVDDVREPPSDWEWAKSYDYAVSWLALDIERCEVVSFDHDLGEEKSGYDILTVIERWVADGNVEKLPELRVHSSNPVGRANMMRAIDSINRLAEKRKE